MSINGSWNDLLWPMIITSSTDMRTLANGLALFIGQKYFVEGMASSGLKG